MADINNSLAASVTPLDIGGTLGKIAEIRAKQAYSDSTNQAIQHNQFLYDQGAGYTPSELQTKASTQSTMSDTMRAAMGPAGNILTNDQSPQARQMALSILDRAGVPIDQMTRAHIMSADNATIAQYGKNAQMLGQSSTDAITQTGVPAGNATRESGRYTPYALPPNTPIISNTEAATGGRASPPNMGPPPGAITSPAIPGQSSNFGGQVVAANAEPTQPAFTPHVVHGSDGSISSSITPQTTGLQTQAVERFKQAGDNYGRAQALSGQLDQIEHDNESLNASGWSSTGAGAQTKMAAAKSVNSLFTTLGMAPPIDPTKVGDWEGYNKQTIRAGFDLAKTLGGHQAESIVQSSVSAVPNAENTYFGSKVITSSIRQTVQREVDYYRFATNYAQTHNGDTFGAEVQFDKQFPPSLYAQTAIANAIPPTSIQRLTASGGDAQNKTQFDSVYGKGMADFVLKQAQAKAQ